MKNLKKLTLTTSLICSGFMFGQGGTTFNENGGINSRSIVTNARAAEKATGSQYFNETFLPANINGELKLIRYNAYRDEVEVKNSLDGIGPLNNVKDVLVSTSDKRNTYEYVDYTTSDGESITGYLSVISNYPQVRIYARQRVFLQDETEPTSGYTTYKPAAYKKSAIKYFIKVKENPVVAFSSKKDLGKLYPGKDKDINNFIKTNKISLTEDADLKKLGEFLNTL